ncbi:RNA polymerase II-associated [Fimicolochytrium jonesii]|uniref:RNA polymerase II-associated n=1 Tax=Fimicolochytrium jonesii TaxID=1396493 RepID=UPI0022FF3284|nr:RNA polymerase II-associated [Fimicolochytrium jonesii]KAI8826078.1 RNA polymerase II-associated [Fimicolochytrium jonesii]
MSKHKVQEPKKYGNDWAFRYVYRNDLPVDPFEPKLLDYGSPKDRLFKYEPGTDSLEDKFLFEVTGRNIENGVACAPLAMGTLSDAFYTPREKARVRRLEPEDEELLAPPSATATARPSNAVTPNVLFLRQNKISMSGDAKTYGRTRPVTTESRIGQSVIDDTKIHDQAPHTTEGKLRAIRQTFESVKRFTTENIKHPGGKDLKAMEIFPIFPDFTGSWPDPLVLAVFDADPLEKGVENGNKEIEKGSEKAITLEEAFLKPLKKPDPPHEPFMGYYQPEKKLVNKIKDKREKADIFGRDEDELDTESYDFPLVRDFQYQTKDGISDQLVFKIDNEHHGVFFKRLRSRINFKRQRAKRKEEQDREQSQISRDRPTVLSIRKRPFTPEERRTRRKVVKDELDLEG